MQSKPNFFRIRLSKLQTNGKTVNFFDGITFFSLPYRCFQLMSEIKLAAVCFPQARNLNEEVANALRKGITNG